MRSEQPFVQRNMRPLIERSHGRSEGLLTGAALVEAGAGALPFKLRSLANGAAVRANRTIGPAQFLEMGAGRIFVRESLVSKVASHWSVPSF